MARDITERQREILEYIGRWIREHSLTPTITELADALEMAPPSMLQHLNALERKGYISREPGKPRSLRLLKGTQGDGFVREVPILGRVAAGLPIFSEENHQGTLRVDALRFKGDPLFALAVHGKSMIDAGILPKDLVIVRHNADVVTGDIVVALVRDEATVKRFRRRGNTVFLEPANESFKTIEAPAEEVTIVGKVLGILRTYEVID